jgi:drug/metabolite transporter (DMT)-like permease
LAAARLPVVTRTLFTTIESPVGGLLLLGDGQALTGLLAPAPLAALGATAVAFAAILVRLADVAPSTAAALRFAYALPVLALLADREGRLLGRRHRRERQLALAAGALLGLELVVWHHSIANVGAGLATALFANLQVVFVAVVAWAVLDERPSRRLLVALPVVLAGTLLVSGALEQQAYGRDPTLGAVFGVLAGMTYGGFFLLFRRTGHAGAVAGPLLDVSLAGAVTAALLGLALGELDLTPGWAAHGWLALLALSAQVFGFILIGSALPRLPAALGSMLVMLQPVIAVGFAVLLLAEKPTTLQLAGVTLLLTGVLVASTGRGSHRARR